MGNGNGNPGVGINNKAFATSFCNNGGHPYDQSFVQTGAKKNNITSNMSSQPAVGIGNEDFPNATNASLTASVQMVNTPENTNTSA